MKSFLCLLTALTFAMPAFASDATQKPAQKTLAITSASTACGMPSARISRRCANVKALPIQRHRVF